MTVKQKKEILDTPNGIYDTNEPKRIVNLQENIFAGNWIINTIMAVLTGPNVAMQYYLKPEGSKILIIEAHSDIVVKIKEELALGLQHRLGVNAPGLIASYVDTYLSEVLIGNVFYIMTVPGLLSSYGVTFMNLNLMSTYNEGKRDYLKDSVEKFTEECSGQDKPPVIRLLLCGGARGHMKVDDIDIHIHRLFTGVGYTQLGDESFDFNHERISTNGKFIHYKNSNKSTHTMTTSQWVYLK